MKLHLLRRFAGCNTTWFLWNSQNSFLKIVSCSTLLLRRTIHLHRFDGEIASSVHPQCSADARFRCWMRFWCAHRIWISKFGWEVSLQRFIDHPISVAAQHFPPVNLLLPILLHDSFLDLQLLGYLRRTIYLRRSFLKRVSTENDSVSIASNRTHHAQNSAHCLFDISCINSDVI